jgi:hypothetical protein
MKINIFNKINKWILVSPMFNQILIFKSLTKL